MSLPVYNIYHAAWETSKSKYEILGAKFISSFFKNKEIAMGRLDFHSNPTFSHLGSLKEMGGMHVEKPDLEAAGPGFPLADMRDSFSNSWETAWIDLGGEG